MANKLLIDATFGTGAGPSSSEIRRISASAEQAGYAALWSSESKHDPFLPLLIASENTAQLHLGTSIAVALARSPMTLAYTAYDLQQLSEGRFILGLGSQVKAHIVRRFNMPWSNPAARMREYIQALQAIWGAWQHDTQLKFVGDYYSHTLMTPFFAPDPHQWGAPQIYLAAVGEEMSKVAGEVADGVILHGFTTPAYIREISTPAVRLGEVDAGRAIGDCALSLMGFVVSGDTDEQLATAAAAVKQQIGFYGSTPAYRKVLELHGWAALADELADLARQGGAAWEKMGPQIPDAVLEQFAVVAPRHELAAAIRARFEGVVDRFSFYVPYEVPVDFWDDVVSEIHQAN